ncbi:hypothetical protein K491DRAFT_696944 [Lophiostoma macrostomum CBS 122681]|uniref:Ubiquitin-like domain-containing protein n=1 Tax=Lophiostoma macrostomum CBS 122681 TaxID=1314788 RepID=A0A6A6STG7_9PLEO|nr:hypothetical protein K491DRAFT_696944 [Lophiostoma macrostomum CBS 122681]
MALTCQIPLQDFLNGIQKFETPLGPFATLRKSSMRSTVYKTRWTLFMDGEIAKLRTNVGAKVLSINLLLATHISESVSRLEVQTSKSHATLLISTVEQGSNLRKVESGVSAIRDFVKDQAKEQKLHADRITAKVDVASATVEHISQKMVNTEATVITLRSSGTQLARLVHDLPAQIREMLEQVVRTNLDMYHMLRAIQDNIVRDPTAQPSDCFLFEDVLGRTRSLPYEYFRYPEVFQSFLKTQFQGLPGERSVLKGQYLIHDAKSNHEPVWDEEWVCAVFPGSILKMSTVIAGVKGLKDEDHCPHRCPGKGKVKNTFQICDMCGMEFSTTPALVINGSETEACDCSHRPDDKVLSNLSYTSSDRHDLPSNFERNIKAFKRIHFHHKSLPIWADGELSELFQQMKQSLQ